MLTGRQKNDFKIILTLLALSITLLAVPILAKQQRSKSTNKRSIKGQQVTNTSTTINVQRPLNAAKAPTRIAPITRSSNPQIISGISRNKGLSSLGRVTKSNISQPGRIVSSRQTNGATLGRRSILQLQSSISVRAPSKIKMPTGVSSSVVKRNIVSPDNNRNSNKTSRISSQIITTRPSISTILKSPATSTDSLTRLGDSPRRSAEPEPGAPSHSQISSSKTSRIGSIISRQQPSSLRVFKSQPSDQSKDISLTNRTRLGEMPSRSQINSIRTSRIDSSITKQRPSNSIVSRQPSISSSIELQRTESQTRHRNSSGVFETLRAIGKKPAGNRVETERTHKSINLRVVDSLRLSSRPRKADIENQTNIPNDNVVNKTDIRSSPKVRREHPPIIRNIHRHEHVYWNYHNQLCHRIIWPKYRFAVYYNHGPYFTFGYVYPYYLRRYIFVSLGGYWPVEYRYMRYYWYGCHPYWWYGYYPVAREVTGDTYNYYTYNYYYSDGAVSTEYNPVADAIKPVDHNTFADVREKLAQQAAKEPAPETAADVQFDKAVKAFEAGDYEIAIEKFSEASEIATDDIILPFAHSQAFFANEQYTEAAEVLRAALAKVSPEKEGVFYPRGLYSDDDILFEQIERLKQKAETFSFDADLQLLLGYQLLGIGEIDKAVEPLQQASLDLENAASATILLELLAKIRTNTETENTVQ